MKLSKWFLLLLIPVSAIRAQDSVLSFLGNMKTIFPNPSGPTGYYVQPFNQTNPSNPAFTAQDFDVNGPMTRHNLVTRIGYNPDLKAGDHALYNAYESYFVQGGTPQVEWYAEFFPSNHAFSIRPYSFIVNLNTNGVASGIQTDRLSLFSAANPATTFQILGLAGINMDTGGGGTIPSGINLRAHNAANEALDTTAGNITAGGFGLSLDGRMVTGGTGIIVFEPNSVITAVPLWIAGNGITHIKIDGDGKTTLGGLVATGAAAGKTLVCADAAGVIYRSTSAVTCAN